MQIKLKYVYSENGEIEAVILPLVYWKNILNVLPTSFKIPQEPKEIKVFEPSNFRGQLGLDMSISDLQSSMDNLRDEYNYLLSWWENSR